MSRHIQLVLCLSCFVCAAYADQFQLATTSDRFDVSYLKVEIRRDGSPVFTGMTDKIGRITITGLANGVYPADVQDSQGNKKSVNFEINGDQQLKIISVR